MHAKFLYVLEEKFLTAFSKGCSVAGFSEGSIFSEEGNDLTVNIVLSEL